MPPQSRAQRRRKNTQQARRASSAASQPLVAEHGPAEATTADELPEAPSISTRTATLPPPAQAAGTRSPRSTRRPVARPVAEPVDYTADYQSARRDIIRIIVWSGLLFVAMIALRFSGLV
jgi:hypothetical protein